MSHLLANPLLLKSITNHPSIINKDNNMALRQQEPSHSSGDDSSTTCCHKCETGQLSSQCKSYIDAKFIDLETKLLERMSQTENNMISRIEQSEKNILEKLDKILLKR